MLGHKCIFLKALMGIPVVSQDGDHCLKYTFNSIKKISPILPLARWTPNKWKPDPNGLLNIHIPASAASFQKWLFQLSKGTANERKSQNGLRETTGKGTWPGAFSKTSVPPGQTTAIPPTQRRNEWQAAKRKPTPLSPHWISALLCLSVPSITEVVNKYSWINYCRLGVSLPLQQPSIHLTYGMWV